MKPPTLSIIIPAYQEAVRIERSLEELAAYLHKRPGVEVVVVVANSPDGTAKLAQNKAHLFTKLHIVHAGPQVGKGRDVRTGFMEAEGTYRLFMDADLATPLHYIETFVDHLKDGADGVIAIRNLTTSHRGLRKLISSLGNSLVRGLLLPGVSDTQCGFKAFTAEAADELFRRQTILGWGFDMEILSIAKLLHLRIDQVEVPDWKDQPHGTFEGGMVSAALITLGELGLILWHRLTGRYRSKHYTYHQSND